MIDGDPVSGSEPGSEMPEELSALFIIGSSAVLRLLDTAKSRFEERLLVVCRAQLEHEL